MTRSDPFDHLGLIWYHSEPSNVRYSKNLPRQISWFGLFLEQNDSSTYVPLDFNYWVSLRTPFNVFGWYSTKLAIVFLVSSADYGYLVPTSSSNWLSTGDDAPSLRFVFLKENFVNYFYYLRNSWQLSSWNLIIDI